MSTSINPLVFRSITSNTTVTSLNLRAGQLLQGKYIAKDSDGLSTLKVGNTLLQAKLSQTLNPGEKILLEVIKTGTKPVMRLYTNQAPEKLNPSLVSGAIKQNIANQNSATLLLNTIQLVQKNSPLYNQLPLNIRHLMKKLLTQVTPANQIVTPAGVKKAFQNSGLLLERRLFGTQQSNSTMNTSSLDQTLKLDFKASLLQLKQQLTLASSTVNTAKTNQSESKLRYDSYQDIRNTNDGKLLKATPQIVLSNTRPLSPTIDLLKLTTASTHTNSLNSDVSGVYKSIAYGYTLPRVTASHYGFSLKPLLRNSTPYPVGSFKNTFNISPEKLAASYQGLITQLLKMVDASLARINVAQLSSTTVDTDNKQVWLFDIPLIKENQKEHDLIQVKIDVEKENGDDNKNRLWTVQLALDLNTLGPLQAKISLQDNKVQAHFKSSDPLQQQLIEEHLDILRDKLNTAGLLVEKLICTQGLVEQSDPEIPQSLIDEEA